MWLQPSRFSIGVSQPEKVGKVVLNVTILAWAMLPAMFFHQMVQLGRSIARMLRATDFNGLLTRLAPHMITCGQRAHNDFRSLKLFTVYINTALASTDNFITGLEQDATYFLQ